VRAALAIHDWVREEGRIQVRLAVNTGEALVILGARPNSGEGMAAGDVVNTAARLQAAAPVNGILVGERTFWANEIGRDELDRGELEEHLHALERRQFVRRERRSSAPGETQYAFVHVLLRDVAYGQIPRAVRVGKHARAASWIESLGRAEDHAEMLAHHYLSALELARAALRIYQDRHATPLAERAAAALASLTGHSSAEPARAGPLGEWPDPRLRGWPGTADALIVRPRFEG
jgi:hypothetical protein